MPPTDQDWARGFALQAISDLNILELLAGLSVEKCHRLHFLQMAVEKTCKAHLCEKNGREQVKDRHDYISSVLPTLARHFYSNAAGSDPISRWKFAAIKKLAKEIELLAPACKENGTREDNSEYPWEDAHGHVQAPCLYNFLNIDDSGSDKNMVFLIKLIRTAAENYAADG